MIIFACTGFKLFCYIYVFLAYACLSYTVYMLYFNAFSWKLFFATWHIRLPICRKLINMTDMVLLWTSWQNIAFKLIYWNPLHYFLMTLILGHLCDSLVKVTDKNQVTSKMYLDLDIESTQRIFFLKSPKNIKGFFCRRIRV